MKRFEFPSPLYCITDRTLSLGRSNLLVASALMDAGVRILQYREKTLSPRERYAECREIRALAKMHHALFIVNDDIGLALAVSADGVHVGQHDLPADAVRRAVGTKMIVGLSIENVHQLADSAADAADYFGVGPVFATATKDDAAPPLGLEGLRECVKKAKRPMVAIGGIKEANVRSVMGTGAQCAAIISDIVGAEDIGEKVGRILGVTEKSFP
ncbi:MAG: thiamine phosphate synthase [Spirochaetota bacterium]